MTKKVIIHLTQLKMFSKDTKITKINKIKDALIIEPSNFTDHRGSIRTIFDNALSKELNMNTEFFILN